MSEDTIAKEAVVIERIFDAPVDLIWQMWTQPDHFKEWYGPEGFTVPVAEMDVRVGGKRLVCMESPDRSMKMWMTGEYLEVVSNERLVYTDSMSDENGNVISPSDIGMPDGHPEDAIMPFEYLARISLSIRGYRMTRPSRFASVDAFIRLTRPSSVSAHIVRWVIRPPPDTSLGLRLRCCGSISGFQLVSQLTRV